MYHPSFTTKGLLVAQKSIVKVLNQKVAKTQNILSLLASFLLSPFSFFFFRWASSVLRESYLNVTCMK